MPAGTGVTSPTQWLDSPGVSTGTGRISRRGSPAIRAYRSIISRYVSTSGPPRSKVRLTSAGIRPAAISARSTSRTATGWTRVCTQLGVTITGSRSVRYRSISNEAEPEPMITAARSAAVGTPESSRIRPTSARDRRCGESSRSGTPAGARPPRYTSRRTSAARARSPKTRAASRSVRSKPGPVVSACTR
ncbi:hypothetical protein GCM10018782_38600 [Streptomyces griseoaurantiacus]|nr:hypothetical protein GCM10018782_38600 [Streptomyces griseoaurantiacus]